MALLPRTSKHPNQSGLALSWEPGSSLQTQGVPEEFTGILELPVRHGSTFQLTAHLHGLVALCSSWERCSCIFRGVLEQGAAAASPAWSSSSHVLSFSRFYTETPNFCLLIVFIFHSYPQRMEHHPSGLHSALNHLTASKVGSSSLAVGDGNSQILLRFMFHWLEVRLLRAEPMGWFRAGADPQTPPLCCCVPALQPSGTSQSVPEPPCQAGVSLSPWTCA